METAEIDQCITKALDAYNARYGTQIVSLREQQYSILRLIPHQDVLGNLPTGYGKSLSYELLPFFMQNLTGQDSIVLVSVPLNAIMEQQLQKLGDDIISLQGETIKNINSSKGSVYSCLKEGKVKFIIGHPEAFKECKKALSKLMCSPPYSSRHSFIIIDEAHCILEWGPDFRKEFLNLSQMKSLFQKPRILALSATMTEKGQRDIARALKLSNYAVVSAVPTRDNISLSVLKRPSSTDSAEEPYCFIFKPLIEELAEKGDRFPITIVYTTLRWVGYGFEYACKLLKDKIYLEDDLEKLMDRPVAMFHAQLEKEGDLVRSAVLSSLRQEEGDSKIRLVFSTIALGMGADLGHVRRIVHAGPPTSLEAYLQEIGRAGRDGEPAEAVLYYNNADVGSPSMTQDMKSFCLNTEECRRNQLNQYFGKKSKQCLYGNRCCNICNPDLSNVWEFGTRNSYVDKHLVKSIQRYVSLDKSGELQRILSNDTVLAILSENSLTENLLIEKFRLPKFVAFSVMNLISCHRG